MMMKNLNFKTWSHDELDAYIWPDGEMAPQESLIGQHYRQVVALNNRRRRKSILLAIFCVVLAITLLIGNWYITHSNPVPSSEAPVISVIDNAITGVAVASEGYPEILYWAKVAVFIAWVWLIIGFLSFHI